MNSPDSATAKASQLQADLRGLGRVLVAYSGGVDSAYLAWAAHRVLGSSMLAVIADSPSLARTHLADAIAFAEEQGILLEVISTSELERPEYARNDGQRCFQCKDELFTVMENLRTARGFDTIAYGVNVDDQGDFRPGQQAQEVVMRLYERPGCHRPRCSLPEMWPALRSSLNAQALLKGRILPLSNA